ncbi:MAG TPA: TerC/Alx family metal homeostasis membrane protein [Thermoanaerobaculia bacterium]|nr:TerC/Alx family metal homeostasis membrane protein [Thermoanaerobaculia bacterium]
MPTPIAGSALDWGLFMALVLGLLTLDIGLLARREPSPGIVSAAVWSVLWTAAALGFNLWAYLRFGRRIGLEFLSAYIVERSLSFDNLFIFLLIFNSFAVPREQQRRVLLWGILGALLSRGLFIGLGAVLLARFSLLLLPMGAFLAWTGSRLVRRGLSDFDSDNNRVLRWTRRVLPVTGEFHGGRFFVRDGGRTLATPLLLVLVAIETTDIAFAVDSIPAAFGVSRHAFIVFSSNVFAILGLRALYPLVGELMRRLRGLGRGLGLMLVLVGLEMMAEPWVDIPAEISLALVTVPLAITIAASLRRNEWRLRDAQRDE